MHVTEFSRINKKGPLLPSHSPQTHTHTHKHTTHTHSPSKLLQHRPQVSISSEMIASPCSRLSITGYHGHIFALSRFSPPNINGCFHNYCHLPSQGTSIECLLGCQTQCLAWKLHYFVQCSCILCWQLLLGHLLCR